MFNNDGINYANKREYFFPEMGESRNVMMSQLSNLERI